MQESVKPHLHIKVFLNNYISIFTVTYIQAHKNKNHYVEFNLKY